MPTKIKISAVKTKKPATRVKKVAAPSVPVAKEEKGTMSVAVVGVDGKSKGHVSLPEALFGAPANAQLLSQAVRVYLANQREGGASTKTRGEVEGSTRKIYRQKGTGKARHGAIRAPIFVGGGIVFGPRPKDFRLEFPKKMRRMALASALSARQKEQNVQVMDGLETLNKTKRVAEALEATGAKYPMLLVIAKDEGQIMRCARNIADVETMPVTSLNVYAVLAHKSIVVTRAAVKGLRDVFTK